MYRISHSWSAYLTRVCQAKTLSSKTALKWNWPKKGVTPGSTNWRPPFTSKPLLTRSFVLIWVIFCYAKNLFDEIIPDKSCNNQTHFFLLSRLQQIIFQAVFILWCTQLFFALWDLYDMLYHPKFKKMVSLCCAFWNEKSNNLSVQMLYHTGTHSCGFLSVSLDMIIQNTFLCKYFITLITLKWLLVAVYSEMLSQMIFLNHFFSRTYHIEKVFPQCVFWDAKSKILSVQMLCYTEHTDMVSPHCEFSGVQSKYFSAQTLLSHLSHWNGFSPLCFLEMTSQITFLGKWFYHTNHI